MISNTKNLFGALTKSFSEYKHNLGVYCGEINLCVQQIEVDQTDMRNAVVSVYDNVTLLKCRYTAVFLTHIFWTKGNKRFFNICQNIQYE